jgi:NAD-dependent protein deacetylases, SIR2 family
MFLPDFPKPTGLELLSHLAEQFEPILKTLAVAGGAFALWKWVKERNNRATDVLLELEEQFEKKCKKGRPLIEHDWRYNEVKELLRCAVARGERSPGEGSDPKELQTAIDNLLRFYVVLCGVRFAKQIPDKSLSTCYRFWLAHYYRKDRNELRLYINEFFPTLRKWLLADSRSNASARLPFSLWKSKKSFFSPEHFWDADDIELDPLRLILNFEGRTIVFTGAGISAESGIPTFRGRGGYWRRMDPQKLATQEAFKKDPELVWQWYRERRGRIRGASPNSAHEAIVKLACSSREFLLVTQNVDNLHARAEWNGKRLCKDEIVQVHGNIFVTRCSRCDFSRGDIATDDVEIPKCPRCNALMRPGVVWFDEELNSGEVKRVEDYLSRGSCDLVIAVGTTATFDYIVSWVSRASRRPAQFVEINPSETPLSSFATVTIRDRAGIALPRLLPD